MSVQFKSSPKSSRPAVVYRSANPSASRARSSVRVAPTLTRAARLQALEDRLLDALLDHHPRGDRALDRLLEDVSNSCAPAARLVPQFSPAAKHRIEDLLVGATLDHHPRRERAFDRLLADLDLDGDYNEERERAAFDMSIDNDFDGMG